MNSNLTPNANLTIQEELGRRIRALRRRKGWSQTAMAAFCRMHVSHLSKLERGGANATLSTLLAVATALQVNVCDLLQDTAYYAGYDQQNGRMPAM